jgi:hypothetical protein
MTDLMTSPPERIQRALDQAVEPHFDMCGCLGPRNGEPRCPCAMQNVVMWRGTWVEMKAIRPEVPKDFLSGLKPS